ncbi:sigma-70 family RNA polymerase sigma factor [Thalassotalea sp. 1_MG-2023]|uniref:sigma-70 family RNA polymerase sigma factor n=1 Tax=Thalassotalea sp. 1_MG-2023 TaxID=3062680 RepID=UPI0026E1AA79|nr:sigma-70 family RNA polymerase sigma factor [Thalassotalea sp. 1_MG-2023]MDO6427899.1 sigma-70 family RNA polymerase sigma factor [Thalassotalea sp. 1_MG-2023]
MAVRQINLSVIGSSVTPKAMNDSAEHQQLSQWLISVAEQRDKLAFSELFKFFAPKILRIAKTKIGSEAQASEVVQETMSNVWRKAHLFDAQKGAATTWVYTVMRNVTFDLLRKVKSNREDTLSDDIWPIAEQSAADDELFEDHLASNNIMSVIETLPENQQQVIKGFYFMEMSQEQLANHLGLPLGTIKSRLRLALAKLKAQLGADHD